MSNTKHLADLLKVCSILPALAIMPAMAAEYTSTDIEKYPYTVKAGDSLVVTQGYSNAENGVFHNNGNLTIGDGLVFSENNTDGYGATVYIFNKNATYTKIGNNVVFSGGTSLKGTSPDYDGMGGAIYTWSDGGKDGASGANVFEMGDNVVFRGNSAVDGGAIYTYGYNTITVGDNLVVENNFSVYGGAAIVLNGYDAFYGNDFINTMDVGKNATFKNNTAFLRGGAIYIGGSANDKATFDDGARFVGNASSFGGAVSGFGTFEFGDVSFESNLSYNAWEHFIKDWEWGDSYKKNGGNGGAILNSGEFVIAGDASFANNYAEGLGGAIYNNGNLTFDGNVVFSGNKDKVTVAIVEDEKSLNGFVLGGASDGKPNDIHNIGTLDIASGTTVLDGGITGDGTLNIAKGAVLDIGTTLVEQGTINLDGTVVASLLNDSVRGGSYGRLIGNIIVGKNAEFELKVGAVGTYNVWGNVTVDEDKITVGDIYEIAGVDANGVKIITKSVDAIAQTKGISVQAAGTVAGLANATDSKAHRVSLALQKVLNSGDVESLEQETAKLNPTDKPVAQAAAASVQNQVLSLAAGRMAGGVSVGRAGGDEIPQENGFWMQGLFNKSKLAGEFHGYTRGVALGADTLIDRKWTIGGGLAFNNSDIHTDGRGHTNIDSKTLFLYGQYKPAQWFINGALTYNMAEYTESMTIAGAPYSVEYDVDAYGAQFMGGYDFATGITTEAGLRYLHVAQDGYFNGLNDVSESDTDFLSGVAGLKYAFAIENDWAVQLRPELRAAMTYDFISDDAAATVVMPGVASYKVSGERLSRMGGEFGIGLTALYKGMELSVMYDLDLHKDYTSQTGMIKFRTQF